jgi:hypothetical protein
MRNKRALRSGDMRVRGGQHGIAYRACRAEAPLGPEGIDISGIFGGRCRIRTYDFHRVKVTLYR